MPSVSSMQGSIGKVTYSGNNVNIKTRIVKGLFSPRLFHAPGSDKRIKSLRRNAAGSLCVLTGNGTEGSFRV